MTEKVCGESWTRKPEADTSFRTQTGMIIIVWFVCLCALRIVGPFLLDSGRFQF